MGLFGKKKPDRCPQNREVLWERRYETIRLLLTDLITKHNQLTMKVSELAAAISTGLAPLRELPAQLEKVKAEVLAAIQANNPDPDVPQNVVDALAGLSELGESVKMGVQKVDDLIADAPQNPA